MWLGFGSLKGSPGATTLAVVIAGLWPADRPILLLEADLDGGSLAARFGLNPDEPGIVSLAAAIRHGIDEDAVWSNTQALPGGLPALVGPSDGAQMQMSLAALVARSSELISHLRGTDVLVDLGRLRFGGGESSIGDVLDLLVIVVRPDFEELDRLVSRLASTDLHPRIGVVLMGSGPYGVADVSRIVATESDGAASVLGHVSHDPRGAAALNFGRGGRKALNRSLLVRSSRSLVEVMGS